MKKSLHLCAALFGAALFSGQALANDSTFVRASAAWFQPVEDDIFDGELGTLVAVGRDFGKNTVELEAGYVELSGANNAPRDLEIIPVTVGYRYNIEIARRFTLGLGVNTGVAITELNFLSASDDDTVWIASGVARLGFAVTEKLSLSAGYRYTHVDDLEYSIGVWDDADLQVFDLGLEFHW